ncbi:precorrin-8X methylmutase [Sneathiella sp. CAU 1612]|uniref:Precorrin-8X methylmutase n=1 Tax=Sneathiella sedimenti TaxID=2816034 RepID=A0ABS3F6L9_9PROT|nr:precorrin-8X methylmutase [Sneathiella sedimenti]MBO0334174.1 precorrin-8X methylmutase [Sneathiella sedimenti]
MYDYLRDPAAIYAESFATIEREADFAGFDAALQAVATRIIHACGMPEILPDLSYHRDICTSAIAALRNGAPIFCDCEMVTHGIIRRFLPADNDVICTLNNSETVDIAAREKTTRSAAAIDLWLDRVENSVAVFGNAPTALFHLLEQIENGAPKPAAILAFPVGFVGAAESKQAMIDSRLDVPYITLRGRKGGSAMAAAALNALASLAGKSK